MKWLKRAVVVGLMAPVVWLGYCIFFTQPTWLGTGPYRIVRVYKTTENKVEKIRLFEFIPEANITRALDLAPELLMETWGYPGTYRLSAIETLSKKETGSTKLLVSSIQYSLGVFINRYEEVRSTSAEEKYSRALISGLMKDMFTTQIPFKEGWQLLKKLQKRLNQEITVYTLKDIGAITQVTEVDGLVYLSFNKSGFDEWYQKTTPVISQALRDYTISLENTTGEEGLGGKVERVMSHQGFNVIKVGDGPRVEKTEVIFANDNKLSSPEGGVIQSMVKGFKVITGDTSSYRSDVVIRIGKDFIEADTKD